MAVQSEKERLSQEFLEQLWTAEEEHVSVTVDELLHGTGLSKADWKKAGLEKRSLVHVQDDGRVALTEEGRDCGRRVVRQHRLAERLLADILHVEDPEEAACRFEHAIDEHVADHICTLLGHPTTCPHGMPIPPGECCKKKEHVVESAVRSLTHLRPGESGTVLYVSAPDDGVIHRLAAMGIVPGAEVTLHQDHPGKVIRVGATQVALDAETVGGIYVRMADRSEGAAPPGRGRGRHRWRWGFWRRQK